MTGPAEVLALGIDIGGTKVAAGLVDHAEGVAFRVQHHGVAVVLIANLSAQRHQASQSGKVFHADAMCPRSGLLKFLPSKRTPVEDQGPRNRGEKTCRNRDAATARRA